MSNLDIKGNIFDHRERTRYEIDENMKKRVYSAEDVYIIRLRVERQRLIMIRDKHPMNHTKWFQNIND